MTEQNVRACIELFASDFAQGFLGNGFRAHFRKLPLVHVGVCLVQGFRGDELKHGVAKEFQTFVVFCARILVREGAWVSASTSRSGSSVVPSASSSALAVISPSETADASALFWVIIVLGFVVGMRRRSSPRCSGRCVRGNKPANLADCYANNDPVQSTLHPCRGGNAGKCADTRWMRYLADAR